MPTNNRYYKLVEGKKVYFEGFKRIGTEYEMIMYMINSDRMSSSKAHKEVTKIKEQK